MILNDAGLPVVALAAAVLAAEQVSFVLVGSAALWLRGEPVTVGDVDVVFEPGEANLRRLAAALAGLAVRQCEVQTAHRLRELSGCHVVRQSGLPARARPLRLGSAALPCRVRGGG